MSFLLAAPEALVTATSDLAGLGSTLTTAHAAAALPTTGVAAAAADEVSTRIAAVFSQHGQQYQQLSARVAAFHEQFVQTLSAGANTYAAAEANAVRTLVSAVNAPAELVLGHSPIPGGVGAAINALAGTGRVFSVALTRIQSVVLGSGGSGLLGGAAAAGRAGALLLRPTGGVAALTAAGAALAPAANAFASIGDAIENAYLAIEPWVQYGFELAAWAVGYLPYIGWLAPQINYLYNLFEPIVQSVLFNALDFLDGTVSFTQGLSNIWSATTASINQFITAEIYWVRGFFPPFPPLPPIRALAMPTPPG